MRKLTLALLLGLCAIGLLSLFFLCSMPQASGGFGDTPRAPISINGNAQFDVAHGVNGGGDGSAGSPWIIENWVISASSASGIKIQNTTAYFIIRNCLVENGGTDYNGIYLNNAKNGRIENNACLNNVYGIYLESSSYDNLTGNTCSNNADYGICMESSSYGNLTNNICENNTHGIYFSSSSYENLTGNTCENNSYNFSVEGTGISHFDHNIDNSNLVNGKPIYYFKDNSNLVIGSSLDIGYLGFVRCDNIKVENLMLENNGQGILFASTENSCIENCILSKNTYGIYLASASKYDNLTSNTCSNNSYGIYLVTSSYGNLTSNICENNSYGIYLHSSSYDNLISNATNSNNYGILLISSSYDNLTSNTCENNSYGIYLATSSYGNLTSNICENNIRGIYLVTSSYDNLISNTLTSNTYGVYLSSSSSNTLTGNVISNNRYDIYNAGTINTYFSNQFNNNMTSKMLTFTENTRTENVGDNVTFSVRAFNPGGTAISGCTTITTSPSETVIKDSEVGENITGHFTATRSGTYSLNFTVTDSNSNTTKRRMLFFVGNTASTTTKYYFRGIYSTHGQPTGIDAKALLLTAPTSTEMWTCAGWILNSLDEIPNYPLANLSAIDTYTWYKQSMVSGAYIGAQRYVTYDGSVDENNPVDNVSDYTWINENFAENWTMDYPQNWYWLSLKLYGDYPYWTTFPPDNSDKPSYANFTYSYTTTPIVKFISNLDIVLLSATAPVDDNENATIVLDGTGSTNIVLDNYHRPFIGYTTTIDSDNTATLQATGLTDNTTINSVAMDITPSSGYIDVSIDNWNTSGTYYKKWTENGSSPGITASHTIGDLKANTYYTVKVDGTKFNTYKSDSSGQITFTYNGGDSTKTFEIEHIPPNKPDTLRVEGQVSPQRLTTFTPEFSFCYTDNDNANSSMVQIQVGTSAGDNSMWDNQQVENVENGATISITYTGTTLQRDIQYYWRVRVRDNENSWSDWSDNENFKLSPTPTVTVSSSTIELKLLEAGDVQSISTSIFTMVLTAKTRSENLIIYYSRIDETPSIPTAGIVPFYFSIRSTNPDAILDATITFNIPKSWVIANNIIPATLAVWRNSDGTWQALPSRLASEDELYYYLEATTSGFSLFGVSGQKVAAPTELPTESPPSQTPAGDQQTQIIFIVALGILITSAMLLASTFKHQK